MARINGVDSPGADSPNSAVLTHNTARLVARSSHQVFGNDISAARSRGYPGAPPVVTEPDEPQCEACKDSDDDREPREAVGVHRRGVVAQKRQRIRHWHEMDDSHR